MSADSCRGYRGGDAAGCAPSVVVKAILSGNTHFTSPKDAIRCDRFVWRKSQLRTQHFTLSIDNTVVGAPMENATLGRLRELWLPDDFEIELEHRGLVIRSLRSRRQVVAAIFEPLKFRGATCRRALATLEDGSRLVLEFSSFRDDYADIGPVAILRGTPLVEGDCLNWERVAFQRSGGDLPAAVARMENCRAAWRSSGIS